MDALDSEFLGRVDIQGLGSYQSHNSKPYTLMGLGLGGVIRLLGLRFKAWGERASRSARRFVGFGGSAGKDLQQTCSSVA